MKTIQFLVLLSFICPILLLAEDLNNKIIEVQYTDINGVTYIRYEGERNWQIISDNTINTNPLLTRDFKLNINMYLEDETVVIEYYDNRGMLNNKFDILQDDLSSAIEDFELNSFKVYPNPNTDVFTIEFILEENAEVEIALFQYNGSNYKVLVKDKFLLGQHILTFNKTDIDLVAQFVSFKVNNKKTTKMIYFK